MTPADWPIVQPIYAEGIATGDATLEREAPDWDRSIDSTGRTAGWSLASRRDRRSWAGSR